MSACAVLVIGVLGLSFVGRRMGFCARPALWR
jgi:hypothetical protein